MNQAEFEHLWARAQSGHAESQETLAELFASVGRVEEARQWLARAAEAGRPSASTRLGLWEIVGFGGGRDVTIGLSRIIASADAGHADAAHAASIILAGGVGVASDRAEGFQRLVQAGRLGHERARTQLHLLGGESNPDLAWVERPFNRVFHSEDPHIESLPEFLPRHIREYVIRMAAPRLVRGKVVDAHGGESVSRERSNAVMTFGLADSDFLLELVNLRTAAAAGMPPENAEGLGVLHYLPGESYSAHADFIPDTPANAAQLAERGQRVRTLLVYLNDGFAGGETVFPLLDLRFRPPAGTALLFHNVDDLGHVSLRTQHAGTSPSSGEKWLISKWFRSKALRPGPSG
jgi:prolyl 4-hydroxylase